MKKFLPLFLLCVFAPNLLFAGEPVIHHLDPSLIRTDRLPLTLVPPEADEIVSPAQFNRVDGVLLAWANWDEELIRDIAYRISQDDYVYVLVASAYFQSVAAAFLEAGDVNMDNVHFIIDPNISNTSMWIRDYGPFYIYEDGTRAIVDFFYGVYYSDDDIPYTIADEFDLDIYDCDLLHHGGNFICDGNGMGFCTTNIFDYNPAYSETEIRAMFRDYLGIDSLVVIDRMINDGTGHIDMFCKLLSDTLIVVGEYETPEDGYPGNYDILNDNADYLSGLTNLQGRQFRVERMLMPPFVAQGGPNGIIPYSYTNSLICNSNVLVPVYGFDTDQDILDQYTELMPGYEVYGIDSSFIIEWWGAVHCVTNLHFASNPLTILHTPVETAVSGSDISFSFRSNPGFENSMGSLLYREAGDEEFYEIPCSLDQGVWTCTVSTGSTDLEYYLMTSAVSGDTEFVTVYPQNAPDSLLFIDITGSAVNSDLPAPEYHLMSYPNPFQPDSAGGSGRSSSTFISFICGPGSDSRIEIFNLKGQLVREILIPASDQTRHEISWDGSDTNGRTVDSGIYYIILKIDDKHVQSRKCMIIR